ncbi:MAG: hypothetical protein JWN37_37 [Candidatus Nomurabacteria bacterium]|nr:hypothetical protein [Candidatus Nomurabacteria bacterium]
MLEAHKGNESDQEILERFNPELDRLETDLDTKDTMSILNKALKDAYFKQLFLTALSNHMLQNNLPIDFSQVNENLVEASIENLDTEGKLDIKQSLASFKYDLKDTNGMPISTNKVAQDVADKVFQGMSQGVVNDMAKMIEKMSQKLEGGP